MNATQTSPAKKTCSVTGCEKTVSALKMCKMHYTRQSRHGSPHIVRTFDHDEMFDSRVDKSESCWNWTGTINVHGYGSMRINGKTKLAHRISYEKSVGEIPNGMQIDHVCHRRSCVNPAHLRPVTQKQNQENLSKPRSDNQTGVRGVSWVPSRKRYRATVGHNGKRIQIGYFKTLEEASEAAKAKRIELFTHNQLDRI